MRHSLNTSRYGHVDITSFANGRIQTNQESQTLGPCHGSGCLPAHLQYYIHGCLSITISVGDEESVFLLSFVDRAG
jgi:hypothetical protein